MKIYLFNPETGVYLGEDFTDEALMKQGGYVIPSGATTIAPPEGGRGHILVFDVDAQCWETHSSLPINQCWETRTSPSTNLDKPSHKEIHHYFSGSYFIFIGIMLCFAALCDDNKYIGLMSGLSLILGTTAYMSLKERMLDPAKNTRLRKCIELGSILFIFLGYLWELSSPRINNTIILLNSVTPITAIAIYFYFLGSWLKRVQVRRYRGSNINKIDS
jgi:hypothetical protein